LTNPTTAIVYWHVSDFALTTFIIKHGMREPIAIQPLPSPPLRGEGARESLPSPLLLGEGARKSLSNSSFPIPKSGVNVRELQAWVNQWDKLYGNYTKQKKEQDTAWRDNLPEILVKLGEILDIPAILEQLQEESIKNLILIPHRDLHRFPLHALFPDRFVISYLPSAQIGINLWRGSLAADGVTDVTDGVTENNPSTIIQPKILPTTNNSSVTSVTKSVAKSVAKLLTIEYPNSEGFPNLPFAEIEAAAITQLFPNHQRIAGENATKTAVTAALTKNYNIFHFTGHGNYNCDRPQNSALFLNGKNTLTLKDICTIPNLSNYKLVTLAACETAITGKEGIEKDYVGLASAFLYQRVAHVLSTLWTIPEEGSSLFTIYFYWQLRHGKEPAIALKITQKWLRTLTYSQLERYYKFIFAKLPKEEKPLRPHLRNELWQISKMDISQKNEQPFNHPYYWAAFTLTGKTQPSQ
jgi:CHAT domain-containing protein